MQAQATPRHAPHVLPAGGSFMFFERGSARFCAPVDDVQAIAQVGEVHALPFRRKGIAGIFMFRGRVALLFDPGAALALDTGDEPAAAILAIVVAFPEGTVAFRVDRVSEIVAAASLQRPAGGHNALTDWMDGYAMQGSDIAFLTTFDKLMRLLIDADLEGGLAAVFGAAASAAASALAAPAHPSEPARTSRPEEIANPADARAVAKPVGGAINAASPRAMLPARTAARPARAPATRPRPVRAAPIRPPAFAHRRIVPLRVEPLEETCDALPVEPDYAPESESATPDRRTGQAPAPASEAASARVSPPQAPSRVVANPVAAAAPAAATRVEPQPATVARPDDRAPPARRRFALAAAACVLLALALGAFVPDWGGNTPVRRAHVAAPEPAAAAANPAPPTEQPPEITIIGKDFELRVERGAANTPAAPSATTGETRHIVVRGDTLWAIATRYLGNPYRYPELAQNSRIRNPDLIHPGDVVIIVRRR